MITFDVLDDVMAFSCYLMRTFTVSHCLCSVIIISGRTLQREYSFPIVTCEKSVCSQMDVRGAVCVICQSPRKNLILNPVVLQWWIFASGVSSSSKSHYMRWYYRRIRCQGNTALQMITSCYIISIVDHLYRQQARPNRHPVANESEKVGIETWKIAAESETVTTYPGKVANEQKKVIPSTEKVGADKGKVADEPKKSMRRGARKSRCCTK